MALLTVKDFTDKGYSREHGEREVAKLVFGADHKTDAQGRPIEQGKGSALQQTAQHLAELERQARASRMVQGWTPPEQERKPRHARSNKRRPPRQKPEPAEHAAE